MALSDEKREQVKALLATGASMNDVAKKAGISWSTVRSIKQGAPDEIEDIREQKRLSMIDKLWDNMEDALELGHSIVKKAKQGVADVPLSHISTYYGTLYDKHALMTGGKTAQMGIDGEVNHNHEYHIEETITTDPDTANLIKQLWKRQAGTT